MKREIQNTERRGLPGGPNEMFTYTTGVFSTEGFRMDSPDVNNYQNIIPSGSITMKERDGSPLRKGPIHGVDNLGNAQVMYPGFDYQFPGTEVTETLMAKMGGALLDKTIKCGNCGWQWKAADGGSDVMDCHKCGGKGLIKAQVGTETFTKNVDSSLQFQKDWMNSSMYKQMLSKSTKNDWIDRGYAEDRLKNLEDLTKGKFYKIRKSYDEYGPTGELANSNPDTGVVTIYQQGMNNEKREKESLSHEISHATDNPRLSMIPYRGRLIPQSDIDLIEKYKPSTYKETGTYLRATSQGKEDIKKLSQEYNFLSQKDINYKTEPTETRARLNLIRQYAKENNIYDPFTQKITPRVYENLFKNKDNLPQGALDLRSMYTKDEFIDLLNTVSQNDNKNDTEFIAQVGLETKPLGAGKYYTTTGKVVDWGTPEYETAYNRGEVLSDKGVPSEVTMQGGTLPEVVIKNNYKRGFLEKYRDKIVEENKDAGLLGAIIGTPISAITSLPQLAATYAITGKVERPSEAMGIQNPYGAMAVDAIADPSNWIGAGELTTLGRLTKEQALAKLTKIAKSDTLKNKERIVHTLDDLKITPEDEIQDLHDNLLNRFNTEEGKRRLGLLGIDNTKLKPADLSFKNTGSGYYPSDNTMDIDLEEAAKLGIDPSIIYAHETAHWLAKQYGDPSSISTPKKFYPTPIDKEFMESYPENFADELLAKNPNVDFNKVSKESSAAYMLNQEAEAFPFLREMRQNMLNKGYINDEYDDISQETINKFIKENPDDRISSFTEPNSKQSQTIYELFKNLPAVVPAAIGVGALQQQAEGGEPIVQTAATSSVESNPVTQYVVKKGDTLSKIAAANNTSVRSIMKNNEGIADPNIISINQKINLATQSADVPGEQVYRDWDTIRNKKDQINKLSDEQKIIRYYNDKPEEKYLIVDKKNAVMKLYTGGNFTKAFEVGIGQNTGDAQTVTKVKDGKTDWTAGNKSTGAGIYTISNIDPASKEYYNLPAFNLKNENGIEVATTIHGTPLSRRKKFSNGTVVDNRMSNGCINGKCEDLKDLYNELDVDAKVYVLPEDTGNNFQIIDGKPALRVSAQNRKKYNSYVDQSGTKQKGQGANQTTNTLVYKPIKASLDEVKFKENVFQWNDFNDEKEYTNTTKLFIAALTTGKKDVMKAAKISSDVYNELAKMSFGIYGTESNFGDTHSTIGNVARAINKVLDAKSSSSPDYKAKATTYGADEDYRSVGLTQLRWNYLNKDEKNALKQVGITSNKDFLDPKKAAVGTVTVLGVRYNQQLNDKQKQDIWKYLPTKWNNRTNYSDRVKSNSSYLSFKQLDKKEMGGESKLGPLMQAYNTMQKKMGGAIANKKQFGGQLNSGNINMYKDYIKGNIGNEIEAVKNYDKLNRIYYSKAKELGMTAANYVMTYVVGNS